MSDVCLCLVSPPWVTGSSTSNLDTTSGVTSVWPELGEKIKIPAIRKILLKGCILKFVLENENIGILIFALQGWRMRILSIDRKEKGEKSEFWNNGNKNNKTTNKNTMEITTLKKKV